jgi:hypothetical protein
MKNNNKNTEMLPEYDFSNGIRGKHYQQFKDGASVTIFNPNMESADKTVYNYHLAKIEPDVAAVFNDDKSINDILRALINVLPSALKKKQLKKIHPI